MNVSGDFGRGRAGTIAAVVALLMLGALLVASSTRADELAFRGCITGIKPASICHEIPSATKHVRGSGLDGRLIAVSADGRSLYAAGGDQVDHVELGRSGAMKYQDCITGSKTLGPSGSGACDEIPTATEPGSDSGLSDIGGLAISSDGKSVYAVGYEAIARFDRDSATGDLTWRGCITGSKELGPSGSGACEEIPTATADGSGSGLDDPADVAVSPDGSSLYVAAQAEEGEYECCQDAAVTRFDRDPTTGALTWRGCISGNTALGPSGTDACALIPSASPGAIDSGLSPLALAVSPDGKSLYTLSRRFCGGGLDCFGASWGLARFDRDPASGALAYRGCLTGDTGSGPSGSGACAAIPSATGRQGKDSGLIGYRLGVSPDGKSVYVGGDRQNSGSQVSYLHRSRTTGALRYRGCITDDRRDLGPSTPADCDVIPGVKKGSRHSGLGVQALIPSPDGKAVYTAGDAQVDRLRRDPDTGAIAFRDCVTSAKSGRFASDNCTTIKGATKDDRGTGLDFFGALAATEDGRSLYGGSGVSVARFGFAPNTRITGARIHGHRASFQFRAGKRSHFECKLKGEGVRHKLRHWRHCGSKKLKRRGVERYRKLGPGKKVFRVRATDKAGDTDPTPAKRRWQVG